MSGVGGAGKPTSEFDNLAALLEFAKNPEYFQKIQDLKDQEEASKKALADAIAAKEAADLERENLDRDIKRHASRVNTHNSEVDAHNKEVAKFTKAVNAYNRIMNE